MSVDEGESQTKTFNPIKLAWDDKASRSLCPTWYALSDPVSSNIVMDNTSWPPIANRSSSLELPLLAQGVQTRARSSLRQKYAYIKLVSNVRRTCTADLLDVG